MLPSKKSTAIEIAALVAALAALPLTTAVRPLLAQAPSFTLPTSVPSGTTVRIDGSSSMATINQTLKQRFEKQFSGTTVALNYSGTPAALQALRDGKIDLAAIGRPLTPEERTQGFVTVPIERGKIAIVVSPDNPFQGSLTVLQFVKIVRGEITDWSQVGGSEGAIRFVDRPDLSDTRAAFGNYGVFRAEPYAPGATAARLGEDSTQTVLQQLGKDGISYAPANQVLGESRFRIIPMHNTQPTDPRYPFSQPFYYVYKGTPSPAIAAFLGYATAPENQQLIQTAQPNQAAISAGSNSNQTGAAALNASSKAGSGSTPTNSATESPPIAASPNAGGTATIGAAPNTGGASTVGTVPNSTGPNSESGLPGWLWLLLPLGLGVLLVGWLLRNRRSHSEASVRPPDAVARSESSTPAATQTPPPPPPLMVPSDSPDAGVASRTESVINADRAAIRTTPSTEIQPSSSSGTDARIAGGLGAAGLTELTPEPDSLIEPLTAPEVTEPPIASTEVVETPSISTQTPEIELSTPRSRIPGEVVLGGAALSAEAAWALRNQAQDPLNIDQSAATDVNEAPIVEPSSDDAIVAQIDAATPFNLDASDQPLTTFDLIDDFDDLESRFTDGDVTELNLDDAPTAIVQSSEINNPDLMTSSVTNIAPLPEEANQPLSDQTVISTPQVEEALSGIDQTSQPRSAEPFPGAILATAAGIAGISALTNTQTESKTPIEEALPETDEASGSIGSDQPLPEQTSTTPIEQALTEINQASSPVSQPRTAAPFPGAILAATGIAGVAAFTNDQTQSGVEAAKFDVGQPDLSSETLATVDQGLPELPQGYGESRIVLMPRDPQWAYAYWDVSNEHKEQLRRQGGQNLVLRLSDVTDIDFDRQSPHSVQQYECEELAREWYLPIPVSDRDYLVEIGYLTAEGRWLRLARSTPVRVPPVYPSDWIEEAFATVEWQDDLQSSTIAQLMPPSQPTAAPNRIYTRLFSLAQGAEMQRVAGSLFGSMQQAPEAAIRSLAFPSGMGSWTLPTRSGMGLSGVGMNMSGIGFSAGAIPLRPRRFWLVADAELMVYGATEPDATVTIAGQPIVISPDGTFRFQMSFQDGFIDYPILATASDGEQTRSIHLKFSRETPNRNTNTKDEATDE